MAAPFTKYGYTDQEADAIHQAIKIYLKPDIRWDSLLDGITEQSGRICKYAQVLYAGDNQRHLKTMEALLERFAQAYDQSSAPLQWHINRQAFEHIPRLDDEAAMSTGLVPSTVDALRGTLRQARERAFDHPYAEEQKRGAKSNLAIRRLVGYLLGVFECEAGIIPTVYSCQHAEGGYNGTAYPFLFACLAPLKLIPHKQLSSAILAAYRQARPGILTKRKEEQQWQDDVDRLKALTQGSKPQQYSKK